MALDIRDRVSHDVRDRDARQRLGRRALQQRGQRVTVDITVDIGTGMGGTILPKDVVDFLGSVERFKLRSCIVSRSVAVASAPGSSSEWTHMSKLASRGATIETTIASSELSRIAGSPWPPWMCSAVPANPKQSRNARTSAIRVGASPTIATRAPWPCRPAACSEAIP